MNVIEVENLSVRYAGAPVPAVDGVSFSLERGECLGIVGGSGCGKSTTARVIVGLEKPSAGRIVWNSPGGAVDVWKMTRPERAAYRRAVQIVFQDTLGALNPRMRIGAALDEVLRVHKRAECPTAAARAARAAELLERVELPAECATRYPHELSGGQRQRVGIARALAVEPGALIADEPVSALDVAVQSQILKLLRRLVDDSGMSLVFVSHDLAVVRCLCDRALVMERGRIVERGPSERLFSDPRHPFTRSLLAARVGQS